MVDTVSAVFEQSLRCGKFDAPFLFRAAVTTCYVHSGPELPLAKIQEVIEALPEKPTQFWRLAGYAAGCMAIGSRDPIVRVLVDGLEKHLSKSDCGGEEPYRDTVRMLSEALPSVIFPT